jgi:hypothetical protein
MPVMAQTTPVKVHPREDSHPVTFANESREDFSKGGHSASEDLSGEELHWPSPPNSPGRKPVLKIPITPPQKALPERSSTYFDALKGRSATGNLTKSPSDGADVRWFYSKKALKGATLYLTSQMLQADTSFLRDSSTALRWRGRAFCALEIFLSFACAFEFCFSRASARVHPHADQEQLMLYSLKYWGSMFVC